MTALLIKMGFVNYHSKIDAHYVLRAIATQGRSGNTVPFKIICRFNLKAV
jgi:hypothetical protein